MVITGQIPVKKNHNRFVLSKTFMTYQITCNQSCDNNKTVVTNNIVKMSLTRYKKWVK